jgi:CheY-like chemotaxis protein
MQRLVEQVLVNLLNNAAKYTEPGGRVWLAVGGEGAEAVVRVKDTGIGLAPEALPRVWNLYAQVEGARSHAEGGLGIGLALVRGLVELHGGKVEARSEGPGKGSEFVVRLPAPAEIVAPAPPTAVAPAPAEARPLRFLVVDDNRDGAACLAKLLQRWGHRVALAHDGPSALTAAKATRPEVVLLDIGLPGMGGHAVARRLRAEAGLESALLVALTGYGQEEDRELSREAGCDFHWVKPVDPDALRDLLARSRRLEVAER